MENERKFLYRKIFFLVIACLMFLGGVLEYIAHEEITNEVLYYLIFFSMILRFSDYNDMEKKLEAIQKKIERNPNNGK